MEKAVDKSRNTWPNLFNSRMEKFFNAPLDEFFNLGKAMRVPAVNIAETDKEFKLTMAVPGMEKSDFSIEAFNGMLAISAEKEKEDKIGRFNRREYNYNSWSRTFTLPDYVDAGRIEAKYEKGELRVSLPKTDVEKTRKVKTINVK